MSFRDRASVSSKARDVCSHPSAGRKVGKWPSLFPTSRASIARAHELLQREIALRREMESVAVDLRSLPPGGEIPEDYMFDRLNEEGVAAHVRISELFGRGDTLMLYHYMFPRHAEDTRPGPTHGALRLVRWRKVLARPAPR